MTKKIIVLDTETAPLPNAHKNDHPDAKNSRVYDLGFIVADTDGVVYERHSFIIAETFFNYAMMHGAYYADKLPQYYAGIVPTINNGTSEWQVVNFLDAWRTFKNACTLHNVKEVYAYNARFDKTVLNATMQAYSQGFRSYFTPYGIEWRDVWDMAGNTICNSKKFVKWCISNGYLSDKGNPKTSAEIVYRYISKDNTFVEKHTALSDAEIELAILLKARKYRKKQTKTMGQGWRTPARIAKELSKKPMIAIEDETKEKLDDDRIKFLQLN